MPEDVRNRHAPVEQDNLPCGRGEVAGRIGVGDAIPLVPVFGEGVASPTRCRKGSDAKKIFLEFWLTLVRQEVTGSSSATPVIQSPTSPKHPQPTQGSPVMGMFRGVECSSLGRNPEASPSRVGKGIQPADAGS